MSNNGVDNSFTGDTGAFPDMPVEKYKGTAVITRTSTYVNENKGTITFTVTAAYPEGIPEEIQDTAPKFFRFENAWREPGFDPTTIEAEDKVKYDMNVGAYNRLLRELGVKKLEELVGKRVYITTKEGYPDPRRLEVSYIGKAKAA